MRYFSNYSLSNNKIRNIFFVKSRKWGVDLTGHYDSAVDLVLTFDFALKREIELLGGQVHYADHLCDPQEMQANNFLAAEFFKKWHFDRSGNDIFTAQGVPFGFAFRIEIWSEYLFYVRLRANLEKLKELQYEAIYVGEDRGSIENILREMGIPFVKLNQVSSSDQLPYFFDVHKYMSDALHGRSFRDVARDALVYILSNVSFLWDTIVRSRLNRKNIYIQLYHPTRKIAAYLQKDPGVRVITASMLDGKGIRKYLFQRLIPIRGRKQKFHILAESLLRDFQNNKFASLCLQNGTDISAGAYHVIERQIQPRIADALQILNSVIHYVEKIPIHLEIMIANIGLLQTIVDCVLKIKRVPSYLLINGLMTGNFLDEAKYATHINGYSESIKACYFNDADNVVTLGDPRMDSYIMEMLPKRINRKVPTVSIGTSGFNPLDLNSYVAVEFDFMFDVLSAFQELMDEGFKFNLIIKVRPNGVLQQYTDFSKEYFPKLKIEILREIPMIEILNKTDLYVSIYSQTLFEASCRGIPVIYYKKDKEFLDPPFDQESELVTVDTIATLKQAFLDFQSNHDRFNAFLDKLTMERYVGTLDGNNLERNLSFIYSLLQQNQNKAAAANSFQFTQSTGIEK